MWSNREYHVIETEQTGKNARVISNNKIYKNSTEGESFRVRIFQGKKSIEYILGIHYYIQVVRKQDF